MDLLRISLFGKVRLQVRDETTYGSEVRKSLELLCYLLLYRQRPHHREALAEILCYDCPGVQSKKSMRQVLWQLQSTLDGLTAAGDPPLLLVDADWLQINPAAHLWLDVAMLEESYAHALDSPGEVLDATAAAELRRAVELYQGELLEGWYQDWCLFERERLHNMYLAMLDKLMALYEARGEYEAALLYGQRVLACDRAHERTHQRLIRLYCLAGDRSAALRQGERCVEALRRDLDVQPSRQTLALLAQVRNGDILSAVTVAPAGSLASAASSPLNDVLDRLERLEVHVSELHARIHTDIRAVQAMLQRQRL
jgi:DNA-binding SARP family transcriptional activator